MQILKRFFDQFIDNFNWFLFGMLVGGLMGIIIHAGITGTLFIK